MGHRIKSLTFNGKVLASDDGTLVKRVLYNGHVIWPKDETPPIPSDTLVMASYEDVVGLFEEVKAGWLKSGGSSTESEKYTIKRILFNGEEIWPFEKGFLSIEKEHIVLSLANGFSDTNTIFTNLTFNIR